MSEYFKVDPRDYVGQPMLTKRELFAAMAMQGFLGNESYLEECARVAGSNQAAGKVLAKQCVLIANRLIEELDK